jgi:hypothetical protein
MPAWWKKILGVWAYRGSERKGSRRLRGGATEREREGGKRQRLTATWKKIKSE